MRVAIITTAVIDEDTIRRATKSIRENIINANPDIQFEAFVSIDNHRRPNNLGSLESIAYLYRKYYVAPNCLLNLTINENRKGQVFSLGELYNAVLNNNFSHSIGLDDDQSAQFNISLPDVLNYQLANPATMIFGANCKATHPLIIPECKDEKTTAVEIKNIIQH